MRTRRSHDKLSDRDWQNISLATEGFAGKHSQLADNTKQGVRSHLQLLTPRQDTACKNADLAISRFSELGGNGLSADLPMPEINWKQFRVLGR